MSKSEVDALRACDKEWQKVPISGKSMISGIDPDDPIGAIPHPPENCHYASVMCGLTLWCALSLVKFSTRLVFPLPALRPDSPPDFEFDFMDAVYLPRNHEDENSTRLEGECRQSVCALLTNIDKESQCRVCRAGLSFSSFASG